MSAAPDLINSVKTSLATTLAAAAASNDFNAEVANSLTCQYIMTEEQKADVRSRADAPIIFTNKSACGSDHVVMTSLRDVARCLYAKMFKTETTQLKTLVVGATDREFSLYKQNYNVHYYLHDSDAKDTARTYIRFLSRVSKSMKAKASEKNPVLFHHGQPGQPHQKKSFARLTTEELAQALEHTMLRPQTIHHHIDQHFVQLAFEDTIYNFDEYQILRLFDQTNASMAYGYAFLPFELIFDDMPEDELYKITKKEGKAAATYRGGTSNGYFHDIGTWSTLLRSPIIKHEAFDFILSVEIVKSIGPIRLFKIVRPSGSGTYREVRAIEVPDRDKWLRVAMLSTCYDPKHKVFDKSKIEYKSFRVHDIMDPINYAMSLDKKSLSFANVLVMLRRRAGGIVIGTRTYVNKYRISDKDYIDIALSIYLYAMIGHGFIDDQIDNVLAGTSVWESFKLAFKKLGMWIMAPIDKLMEFIFGEDLAHKLIVEPFHGCLMLQNDWGRVKGNADLVMELFGGSEPKELDTGCPLCNMLIGNLGAQKMRCKHKEVTYHTFSLSDDEINSMKSELADTDNDLPGLKVVKERCRENLPSSAFSHEVAVYMIEAGPGTGKSFTARRMAEIFGPEHCLVVSPLAKLMSDYVVDTHNRSWQLLFKTLHRSVCALGRSHIMVDEMTLFDYRYLAAAAYLNGARSIYLIGDRKQNTIRKEHGLYIGDRINLDTISTHELVYNFRNPAPIVAFLNNRFGYQMIPYRKDQGVLTIQKIGDKITNERERIAMAFSNASAESNCGDRAATVRSYQGGTDKHFTVYATVTDSGGFMYDSNAIVAFSRHTESLIVVTDEETYPQVITYTGLTDDQIKDYNENTAKYIPEYEVPVVVSEDTQPHMWEWLLKNQADKLDVSDIRSLESYMTAFKAKPQSLLCYYESIQNNEQKLAEVTRSVNVDVLLMQDLVEAKIIPQDIYELDLTARATALLDWFTGRYTPAINNERGETLLTVQTSFATWLGQQYDAESPEVIKPTLSLADQKLLSVNPHLKCVSEIVYRDKVDHLILGDSEQMFYEDKDQSWRTAPHWGQRKLFLTELMVLMRVKSPHVVVYAGSAPGQHIPYLARFFQTTKFHLYDPAEFSDVLKSSSCVKTGRVQLFNEYFTDTVAMKYAGVKLADGSPARVVFFSDIRTSNDAMSAQDTELAVSADMARQQRWVKLMKPVMSSLKFRLPWTEGKTTYLKGSLLIQPYARQTSTETRLVVDSADNFEMMEYDNRIYESQMYYHNTVTRYCYHNYDDVVPELDHCYDCAAEVEVWGTVCEALGVGRSYIPQLIDNFSKSMGTERTVNTIIDADTKEKWFGIRKHDTDNTVLTLLDPAMKKIRKLKCEVCVRSASHGQSSEVQELLHNTHTKRADVIQALMTAPKLPCKTAIIRSKKFTKLSDREYVIGYAVICDCDKVNVRVKFDCTQEHRDDVYTTARSLCKEQNIMDRAVAHCRTCIPSHTLTRGSISTVDDYNIIFETEGSCHVQEPVEVMNTAGVSLKSKLRKLVCCVQPEIEYTKIDMVVESSDDEEPLSRSVKCKEIVTEEMYSESDESDREEEKVLLEEVDLTPITISSPISKLKSFFSKNRYEVLEIENHELQEEPESVIEFKPVKRTFMQKFKRQPKTYTIVPDETVDHSSGLQLGHMANDIDFLMTYAALSKDIYLHGYNVYDKATVARLFSDNNVYDLTGGKVVKNGSLLMFKKPISLGKFEDSVTLFKPVAVLVGFIEERGETYVGTPVQPAHDDGGGVRYVFNQFKRRRFTHFNTVRVAYCRNATCVDCQESLKKVTRWRMHGYTVNVTRGDCLVSKDYTIENVIRAAPNNMCIDYLRTEGSTAEDLLKACGENEGIYDWAQHFLAYPVARNIVHEEKTEITPTPMAQVEHSVSDAYRTWRTFFPDYVAEPEVKSLNYEESKVTRDIYKSTTINATQYFAPLNARGHPQPTTKSYYQLGTGVALKFGDSKAQALNSVVRYDTSANVRSVTLEAQEWARKAVDLWFDEYMDVSKVKDIANDEELLTHVCQNLLIDMRRKHYFQRWQGGDDNPSLTDIMYTFKNSVKPSTTLKDFNLFKGAQGIAAWNSDLNLKHCLLSRIISEIDRLAHKTEGDHVAFTDNKVTNAEFIATMTEFAKRVSSHAKNGYTDQREFDARQGLFTQFIVRCYLLKLGLREEIVAEIMDMIAKFTLKGEFFTTKSVGKTSSGNPYTLFFNGIVGKVTSNVILRGDGPSVVGWKGDDFTKRQMNLRQDDVARTQLANYSDLEITVQIGEAGEFCGFIVADGYIIPNMYRKLNKFVATRFRDYEHFAQYQISMRDNMNFLLGLDDGINKAVKALIANNNMTAEMANSLIACYESWSHVSKEQWMAESSFVTYEDAVFGKNADGNITLPASGF